MKNDIFTMDAIEQNGMTAIKPENSGEQTSNTMEAANTLAIGCTSCEDDFFKIYLRMKAQDPSHAVGAIAMINHGTFLRKDHTNSRENHTKSRENHTNSRENHTNSRKDHTNTRMVHTNTRMDHINTSYFMQQLQVTSVVPDDIFTVDAIEQNGMSMIFHNVSPNAMMVQSKIVAPGEAMTVELASICAESASSMGTPSSAKVTITYEFAAVSSVVNGNTIEWRVHWTVLPYTVARVLANDTSTKTCKSLAEFSDLAHRAGLAYH